jgi:hypothetical protein
MKAGGVPWEKGTRLEIYRRQARQALFTRPLRQLDLPSASNFTMQHTRRGNRSSSLFRLDSQWKQRNLSEACKVEKQSLPNSRDPIEGDVTQMPTLDGI